MGMRNLFPQGNSLPPEPEIIGNSLRSAKSLSAFVQSFKVNFCPFFGKAIHVHRKESDELQKKCQIRLDGY